MKNKIKEHWYFITTYECPLCGSGGTVRERRYGKKPKDPRKRYKFEHYYDGCEERELFWGW